MVLGTYFCETWSWRTKPEATGSIILGVRVAHFSKSRPQSAHPLTKAEEPMVTEQNEGYMTALWSQNDVIVARNNPYSARRLSLRIFL